MTDPIAAITPCEHSRSTVIGQGMRHCPDCGTFWTNPFIGIVPAPDNPPPDDRCVCCGTSDDLVVSISVPLSLWDKNRIPARLAGMPRIYDVSRCRPCEAATPGHPVDHRCEAHGGRTAEFD